MQNQSNRTMSDTADLLQQLLDIRRKVASENLTGGRKKRRKSSGKKKRRRRKSSGKKKRKSSTKKIRYATATTRAGRNRQVWEGRADKTCVGGLTRSQLKINKQGKIVSKAASEAAKKRLRKNPALARKFAQQRELMMRGQVGRN